MWSTFLVLVRTRVLDQLQLSDFLQRPVNIPLQSWSRLKMNSWTAGDDRLLLCVFQFTVNQLSHVTWRDIDFPVLQSRAVQRCLIMLLLCCILSRSNTILQNRSEWGLSPGLGFIWAQVYHTLNFSDEPENVYDINQYKQSMKGSGQNGIF